MPRSQLSPADFKSSVVAVPPIALTAGLEVAEAANRSLVRHIERGGVSILLYGGNANLYHFSLGQYADALAMMVSVAATTTAVIASIGPDMGKMLDQSAAVRRSGLKNVMLLPTAFPSDPTGVANGARRIADSLGLGVILYVKRDGYVRPEELARLVRDGTVRFVKYAVERPDPANDVYLDALISEIGIDTIASGMGETPVSDHIGRRRLATYTSGAVCIAPAAASRVLQVTRDGLTAQASDWSQPFLEFERIRMRLGGIQVLHDAVTASGIAEMGPLMPMLSNIGAADLPEVRRVVAGLLAIEERALAMSAEPA